MPDGAAEPRIRPDVRVLRPGLAAGAALCLAACRPPAGVEPVEAPGNNQPLPVASDGPATEPLPSAKSALELLPAETLAIFEVTEPAKAMLEIGVPEVLTHGGIVSQGASMVLDAEMRTLMENPENLRTYGVDPQGSMGAALLDAGSGAFAGWVTLSDPQLALDTLEKRAGRRFEFRGSRAGQIAPIGDKDNVILRDGILFFVHVDDVNTAPFDYARTIADADPRIGLVTTDAFKRAFARPGVGVARAYAAPAATLASVKQLMDRERDEAWGIAELERELESMRANGASSADLTMIEQEITRMREQAQRSRDRDNAEFTLLEEVFGPVESIALSMSATAGRLHAGVRMRLLTPDSLVGRIFAAVGGPSTWLQASDIAPHALFEGAFDPETAYRFARLVAEADGEEWAEVEAEFLRETGLQLKADIFDQLSGSGAVGAYFLKAPQLNKGQRGEDQMDFGFALGVKDPSAGEHVLKTLASKTLRPPLKRDARAKGYSVELNKKRKLYFAVVGSQFVVSTDLAWMARMRDGSVGAGASKLRRPELRRAFEQADPVARGFMDFTWPLYLEARAPYGRNIEDFERRFHYYRDLGPKTSKKIRWSSTLKKKRALLKRLYAKLNSAETKVASKELEHQVGLIQKLGFVSVDGHKVAGGYEGSFDLLHEGKTFMGVALDLVDEMQRGYEPDAATADLRTQVSELEQEIEQARYAEIDRWVRRNPQAAVREFPIP